MQNKSFTVSWITNQPATGEIHYGTDPANTSTELSAGLNQTAHDDRGAETRDDTHHVTLRSLTRDTTYYFDVVSDGITDDNGGRHYTTTTGPTLDVAISDIIEGQVFKTDGTTPAAGAIVYVTLRDADDKGSSGAATLLSVLVDSDGSWYANLSEARVPDLSSYFRYSISGDGVSIKWVTGGRETVSRKLISTLIELGKPSGPTKPRRWMVRASWKTRWSFTYP